MTEVTPEPAPELLTVEQEARKLAGAEGAIDDSLKGPQLRQATIVAYDAINRTATITLGGDTTSIVGVRHLASYTPKAGDTGAWALKNDTDLILIGALGTGAGTSPTGSVIQFAGSTAPAGWLLCTGQAVSRTDYADLFAVIGTTYGTGNGSTTFNVPNLSDKFVRGKGSAALGATGGAATDAWSFTDSHHHALNSSTSHAQLYWTSSSPEVRMNRKVTNGWTGNISVQTVAPAADTTTNAGGLTLGGSSDDTTVAGSGTVDTIPPFITLNFLIKV